MTKCKRIIAVLLMYSGYCQADFYQANINQANWKYSDSNQVCTLSQDIPQYGVAEFVSRSGESLRFSIQEQRRKRPIIKASLAVMPAPWRHEAVEDGNYQVYLDGIQEAKDYGRLSVYADAAEAMLDVLLQGQYPTFSYIRASSSTDVQETRVAIASVKFAEKYKEFSACRNGLPTGSVALASEPVATRKKPRS